MSRRDFGAAPGLHSGNRFRKEGKVLACHSANQLHAQTGAENKVDRTLATTATDTHASMRRLPDGLVQRGASRVAHAETTVATA